MQSEYKATLVEVEDMLTKRIDKDMELLNRQPITTDVGTDITEAIRGRLNAYIEVKSFIIRGKVG